MKLIGKEKINDTAALRDAVHEIYDIDLPNGATLHRFNNADGIPYSAIYENDFKAYSCKREQESCLLQLYKKKRIKHIVLNRIAFALTEIASAHDSLIGAKDEIESGTQISVMNALQNALESLNLATKSVRTTFKDVGETP